MLRVSPTEVYGYNDFSFSCTAMLDLSYLKNSIWSILILSFIFIYLSTLFSDQACAYK